ncbi:hypothetical protein FRC12_011934 [Ceratobasidium sp. 428]|nr:hypothetical protein FRC12_011934 [Ceratobasidium sp. 428]
MASYNPYAPMYEDPGSPHPRVYEFSHPSHLRSYDPGQLPSSYSIRSTSQGRVWSAYRDGSYAPDPAYAHWNTAGPVPHALHAFYGPERPIEGRQRARARRPSVHAQTTAAAVRWPRSGLEEAGVRKTARRRARGSSVSSSNSLLLPRVRSIHNHRFESESPVELCTPPLGQVPHPNLFARTSASLRSSRSSGPPFVVPRSKLPSTLSRAWRRLWG